MNNKTSRKIILKSRPVGIPKENNFQLVETPVPQPGENHLRVKNLYMSVDPYMRGRMIDRKSYVPPFQVGRTPEGSSVGEVLESNSDPFKPGNVVVSSPGWREYFVSDGAGLTRIDPGRAPVQACLGSLGMPGLKGIFADNHVKEHGRKPCTQSQ